MILNVIVFVLTIHISFSIAFDLSDSNVFKDGKEQYELISSYSQLPKYGECWKNAISNVKNGCKNLNDHIQTNLAIMFTYCLLKHLNYDLSECKTINLLHNDDISNSICYEKLKTNSNSFTTFTEFFTHTQNICFFLQNQVWNEQTVALVKESRKTQVDLLHSVNKAVEAQQKLIDTNVYLQETINKSAVNVQYVLDEFNQQTKTQQMAIFHLFDRLQQIQTYILGEFTLFYSIAFYIFTLILAYTLTSTKRTQSARANIFILLTSMILTECFIISINNKTQEATSHNGAKKASNTFDLFGYYIIDWQNYDLYSYIWICRKFYIYLSFLCLCLSAYFYCDYTVFNNKLLLDIKNEHNEIKTLINEIKMTNSTIMLNNTSTTPNGKICITQTAASIHAESLKRAYDNNHNKLSRFSTLKSFDNDDDYDYNDGNSSIVTTVSTIRSNNSHASYLTRTSSTSTLCLTNYDNDDNDDTYRLSDFDDSFEINENTNIENSFKSTTLNSTTSSIFQVFTKNVSLSRVNK